jgi:hypothetical protein
MNLSDAIRLGAMIRPQAFGDLFLDHESCAMGAAYEAAGLMDEHTERRLELVPLQRWDDLTRATFPILKTKGVGCPMCGHDDGLGLAFVISHLNDRHRWTREQIADWVETVEPREVPAAVDALDSSAVEVS